MLLSFLGLVFIAFIGKFIWDTYVTGKTDRDYQVNLRSNPEQMARMQNTVSRGEHLNFNYSPTHNPAEKAKSLALMANNFDCKPAEAEEKFIIGIFNEMVRTFASQAELIQVLSDSLPQIKQNKYNEATKRVIDPDDTCAALHEAWTKEAIRRLELVVAEDKKWKRIYDDEASWSGD